MSVTQTTAAENTPGDIRCSRCNSILPARATFCGTCGERVEKREISTPLPMLSEKNDRYRMTSLVRRRPPVQLFLAQDTQGLRLVALREIDVSGLSQQAYTQAISLLQQEYDLLRFQQIPGVFAPLEMQIKNERIITISGWPLPTEATISRPLTTDEAPRKLYTLQDLLQSGIGLPDEAVALAWIYHLCRAVQRLHQHAIVLGDLDSSTVVVDSMTYAGQPSFMVFWLPLLMRNLLSHTTPSTNATHFSAPETLLSRVEPRSDVYSLGALLYLLLTGTAPDEPTLRLQRSMRSPHELDAHVSTQVDALVMRALAIESTDRFHSADALALAIKQAYHAITGVYLDGKEESTESREPTEVREEITVSIVPLRERLANMYLSSMRTEMVEESSQVAQGMQTVEGTIAPLSAQQQQESGALPGPLPRSGTEGEEEEQTLLQRFKGRVSGLLPALRPVQTSPKSKPERVVAADETLTFFQRIQRFFLAEQQHTTTAAALIETPLRVQPNQSYLIRIHLTGRNVAQPPPGSRKGTPATGLSALVQGEMVHIEVRSALYQNYAYVVQRADVTLPGNGYSAEVTIPMQPLANAPSGRRERLFIFFTDELRHPLYEKPFVVEVFVSHLVQSGREGYNVLTIPL
jgi:serine/threonine protein kinase